MKWNIEPAHTSAEFRVRHMMVSWVRGSFKNIQGTFDFDTENPVKSSVDISIDASTLWTGDKQRDDHLRSEDFLFVTKHPEIKFKSSKVEVIGKNDLKVSGNIIIRGVSKEAVLDVHCLGQWKTPDWKGGTRPSVGFLAKTRINRYDFGVNWNDNLEDGGIVAGKDVYITIDVEAFSESNK